MPNLAGSARRRARVSVARAGAGVWPVIQGAVGAAVAYTVAQQALGHPHPFFAAVAAFICLGLSDERRLRRVAELAAGVTLGVAVGDLFVLVFGSGAVQIAVVLTVTVLVALLLDGGQLVATQSGVQALLVVALPPTAGSPVARWQDAFIGSAVALVVAVMLPADPRRSPRRQVAALLDELTLVLEQLAHALRRGDVVLAGRVLDQARGTQPLIDATHAAVRGSREVCRIAPLRRRHRGEVDMLGTVARNTDRAARNARVVTRRAVRAVEGDHAVPGVADLVAELAAGVRLLREDALAGGSAWRSRDHLVGVAGSLGVTGTLQDDVQAGSLVLLLRPMVVDLLEATGLAHAEARTTLPAE